MIFLNSIRFFFPRLSFGSLIIGSWVIWICWPLGLIPRLWRATQNYLRKTHSLADSYFVGITYMGWRKFFLDLVDGADVLSFNLEVLKSWELHRSSNRTSNKKWEPLLIHTANWIFYEKNSGAQLYNGSCIQTSC